MKITREGNTFTIDADNDAHAETLEALLKTIALTFDVPSATERGAAPVKGLTLSIQINPSYRRYPPGSLPH